MLTSNDIRTKFLKFFESKGHTIVPSSSLVPTNDPTLMFTNSGMVQFKNVFTGAEKRDYTTATTAQRCVRAGGKHNDLENVGHTARHHTFFEMMGNFSFGDYFKEDAIPYAWEFLTSDDWMGIDKDKLYVTVYHTDDEAFDIWHKTVGVAKERIIRINTNDNFWSMGDTGPCGPCTEIFYDHGEKYWGGLPGTPEEDGDRYIEIWNLVFMQFDRQEDGEMKPLPQTGVDTGCGLERITAVMQGVNNNYDIDSFQAVITEIAKQTGVQYFAAEAECGDTQKEQSVSLRVIADHLRSMSFLMVDGVMPSNEGRGYVLRRIMRRAMRHAHMLGIKKPFIYKIVPSLVKVMGEAYPELARGAQMVMDTIKIEEGRFGKTLHTGMKLLSEETQKLNEGGILSGEVAFRLYDTYGFPLDLTQDAVKVCKITVDNEGFEMAMQEQRERARAASKGGTGQSKLADAWYNLSGEVPATEFLGYNTTKAEGIVVALMLDNKSVRKLNKGDKGVVVTNQTPFYAEAGGQAGDVGYISFEGGKAKVTDTQKILDGTMYQHFVEVEEGALENKISVEMEVCEKTREATRKNHSATHLMHAALQEVLGDHVFQKGSQVTHEKTRFDFSHPKAMTADEIKEVEDKVNAMIWANVPVTTKLMDKDDAVEAGALALFGEKYDDEVRVLFMGEEDNYCSVELCGGMHVKRTGDIGLFKVTMETSISSGVRRIEAVTHEGAQAEFRKSEGLLKEIAAEVKSSPLEAIDRVKALKDDVKKLKQQVKEAQKGGAGGGADLAILASNAEKIGDISFVGAALENTDPALMREMVDDLKNRIVSGIVLLGTNNGDKSTLVAGVTKDLTSQYKAGDIVNAAAATLGGKGGGRPDMAMAGGKAGDMAAAIGAARQSLGA
jgi:alanyl-tRNA synthetase